METLLFFDNWCLESQQNVERKLGKPQWVEEATFSDPHYQRSCYYPSVFWDPHLARWRAFYITHKNAQDTNDTSSLATAESEDGIHWQTPDLSERFPDPARTEVNQVFQAGMGTEPGSVYLDEREPDPARRYKLLYIPGSYKEYIAGTGRHRLAVSADGYQWQPVEGVQWGDWLSDAPNSIFYNRHRDSYVTPCRPSWGDRRVGLVETRDWQHWSKPEVVIHPDSIDPPALEFYCMPTVPYEGMYIGLLWAFHTDPRQVLPNNAGPIDCQLTYSYDGWRFNRSLRDAFVPLNEPGTFGSGSVYPASLCVDKDNVIRIYANGWQTEHHKSRDPRNLFVMMLYTLRLDGFVYLQSTAGLGRVTTRHSYLFTEPDLRINVQAPLGDVWVQLSDDAGKPIEGLSFDDCIPFRGDDLFWQPQWKSGRSLRDVLGRVVRIEVQMYRGRLYAIRGGFQTVDFMSRVRPPKPAAA